MRAVVDAFHDGGGDGKPLYLQTAMCLAETDAISEQIARNSWRQAGLSPAQLADLETPDAFERAAAGLSHESVLRSVRASADVERHVAWLEEDLAMGFARVYLHNVHADHDRFFQQLAPRALALRAHAEG
jgi:hypothetical protein